MPERIAMTGATGFVGTHLLRHLLGKGYAVRVLVRDSARLSLPRETADRVETVQGALDDDAALSRLVAGADVLIHVAGAIAASTARVFHEVNAEGTRRLAERAADADVGRFVHVSSLAARAPHLSPYAASKRAGEEKLQEVAASRGLKTVIVRPPAVYGPGDRATLSLFDQLSRRLALVPGHGRQRLSLIHVADLATALHHLATAPSWPVGEVLEIDDGRPGGYAWDELAELARSVCGRPLRLLHLPRSLVRLAGTGADAFARLSGHALVFSAAKVNELYHDDWVARSPKVQDRTDWTPRRQFAEGFRETLAWYVRAGWLPVARLPADPENA